MARPLLAAMLIAALALPLATCARRQSAPPQPPVQEQRVRQSPVDCHGRTAASNVLCREEGDEGPGDRDTVDGGDDPMNAGCHRVYSDRSCEGESVPLSGDYCLSRTLLVEYTDRSCHTADDKKDYDCDAYCRRTRRMPGFCVDDPGVCEPRGSARCICSRRPRL